MKKLNKLQKNDSLTVASLSSNCQMLCEQAWCTPGELFGPHTFENSKNRAYYAGIEGVIITSNPNVSQ